MNQPPGGGQPPYGNPPGAPPPQQGGNWKGGTMLMPQGQQPGVPQGAPPAAPPFGAPPPPMQAGPGGYGGPPGAPPGGGGYGGPPGAPPGGGGYGGPPGAPPGGGYGGPPPGAPPGGYGGPPPGAPPGGYGGPPPGAPPGGYGGAPPGAPPGGYGAPPGAPPGGYGQPPGAPGGYGQPPGQPGYPQQQQQPGGVQGPSFGGIGFSPGGRPNISVGMGNFSYSAISHALISGEGFESARKFGAMAAGLGFVIMVVSIILLYIVGIYFPYFLILSCPLFWGGLWMLILGQPQKQADGSKAPMWGRVVIGIVMVLGLLQGLGWCATFWL